VFFCFKNLRFLKVMVCPHGKEEKRLRQCRYCVENGKGSIFRSNYFTKYILKREKCNEPYSSTHISLEDNGYGWMLEFGLR